ncbi:MAG: hypothetical protein BGN83_16990 [Rhizobium sp. 63-7]|nr:MAG: hypothetical protein BGN83_16990 [Rhizobium sp. 63-7]
MAYRILPDRSFTAEIRRVGREQFGEAIAALAERPAGLHEAIHDARKNFKRLRGLYRLVCADAKDFRKQENDRLRDTAKSLSGLRDATALIEAAGKLVDLADNRKERQALDGLLKSLGKRRDAMARDDAELEGRAMAAIDSCRQGMEALEELDFDNRRRVTAKRLAKGWRKTHGRAIAALSSCRGSAAVADFHDLRKRSQDYWMYNQLLKPLWPSAMMAKKQAAKTLTDLLGDGNDLSVLVDLLETDEDFAATIAAGPVKAAVGRRLQQLRKDSLAAAEDVYADASDREANLIGHLWAKAAG